MPELPEVETVLRGVERQLGTMPVVELRSLYPGTVIIDKEAQGNVFPAVVQRYERRGKYMLMHLNNGYSLIIHLRMTGKLIYVTGEYPEARHIRAEFLLQNGHRIIFNDIRTFGKIVLCPTGKTSCYIPKLGVEPLDTHFNALYIREKIGVTKRPVKNLLLDQEIVAGLGNIYVCEILYKCGIHPETSGCNLTQAQMKKIEKHTKAILKEAIRCNGTSISDFRQVDDKTGEFQNFLQVYQKKHCPRGHTVERIKQGGRSTFFCPVCQK